jgi:hypothetical protein
MGVNRLWKMFTTRRSVLGMGSMVYTFMDDCASSIMS